jgi:hypothetical protein
MINTQDKSGGVRMTEPIKKTNDEINNLKLKQLFVNVLLTNGYSEEFQANLLRQKNEVDQELINEGVTMNEIDL